MKTYIVQGDTYEHRKLLKDFGWIWNPSKHRWQKPESEFENPSDPELKKIKRLSGIEMELIDTDDEIEEDDDEEIDRDMFV